ncbi:ABC-2 type transport system permease protein [Fontibacillus panacisegetis]|uniref:ABC-2 type transport system permease protein n=1 Tax=Fontibacillus panacisegetis TaxID=670482 RepID=A0A1G7T737_9BACL|nr:ABC transporter permease [Fontibacillus panacisegetis]SDG30430.1 ABC-2 type transport system permease protein [Fontibacillus panacisegetis]
MNSFTIAWNMIKRTVGTKKGMFIHIFLPCLVITVVIGLLGQDDYSRASILYVDKDGGIASQFLLNELADSPDYLLKEIDNEADLREKIVGDHGAAGFIIPEGFTDDLMSGSIPSIRMYELKISEGSYTLRLKLNILTQGMASSASLIRNSSQADDHATFTKVLSQTGEHKVGSVTDDLQLYAKPGLSSVTGFTLMFLMGLVSSSVSQIMDDRRRRTMTRMFSAPVRAWEIAAGNFLGSFFVGILQIAVILVLSNYVLGYDYGVPILLHFIVLGTFMLVAMGISSAVAGLIRNSQQASIINSLIITPTCMIGGCFWPISFMPEFMQKAANFVPQKWTIEAVEILSSGNGLGEITVPLLILGLMALILLAFGSAVLRPSDANVN